MPTSLLLPGFPRPLELLLDEPLLLPLLELLLLLLEELLPLLEELLPLPELLTPLELAPPASWETSVEAKALQAVSALG